MRSLLFILLVAALMVATPAQAGISWTGKRTAERVLEVVPASAPREQGIPQIVWPDDPAAPPVMDLGHGRQIPLEPGSRIVLPPAPDHDVF